VSAQKKKGSQKREFHEAPLIKVKGPERFILSSELAARYEAALHGWDYQSILAAKALERLASCDESECMAALDAARESFRTDLSENSAPSPPKSKSARADELAWIGMDVWFHVVHSFKSAIGNALMDAVRASGRSRSEKGRLIKDRLEDAVNYLLAPIGVVEKPKRHGNTLLVKVPRKPDAYMPFVAAVIETFLEGARVKGAFLLKQELRKNLASKYNDRVFQKKDSRKSTERIVEASKISRLAERTWTTVFSEAGLKFTRLKSSWLYSVPQEDK
jgi:hypothetical protein